MKAIKLASFLFILAVGGCMAQPTQFYFKDSEMKGFPSTITHLANYQNIKDKFGYFNIDEAGYNSVFFSSNVVETGNRASYRGMTIVLPKKLTVEPTLFPNYKLTLNPKLEQGYNSKHRLGINTRVTSVYADFDTDAVEIEFPPNILLTKKNGAAKALINLDYVEFHSDGDQNEFHGIIFKGTKKFNLEPSVVPESIITSLAFENAEFKLMTEEAFQFPGLVFENTRLCHFLSKYEGEIKMPNQYKSSILLKDVEGKIALAKELDCEIPELYFFDNCIAGIAVFPLKQKEEILRQFNEIKKNVSNRSPLKLKPNGDLPSFTDRYKNTVFRVVEELKSVKMYFLIVK